MKDLQIFKRNLPSDPVELNFDVFYENRKDPVRMRGLILQLEEELKQISQIQIQLKTTHRFADGLYSREVFIPKNTVLTGKIHKEESINICSQGDITIITEEGINRVQSPFSVASRPGIKRVGFAHEDTVWTTVHAINEWNIEKIEKQLFTEKYEDLETDQFRDGFEVQETMEGYLCQPQLSQGQ